MPTFPSFYTTGQTVVLPSQPIQYQPLNLSGLIQAVRKPQGTKAAKKESKEDEIKVEGRIGAVESFMRPIKEEQQKIQIGLDLMGADFYNTSDYRRSANRISDLNSWERRAIVTRETKANDDYQDNTKDKGEYYDFTNMQFGLKKVKEIAKLQEYNLTSKLTSLDGSQDYMHGFNVSPTLFSKEDARVAMDAELEKLGTLERGGATSWVEEKFFKNTQGVIDKYKEWHGKSNYKGHVLTDTDGKPIAGWQLDAAIENVMARAFGEDLTDPIYGGYLQAWTQENKGWDKFFNADGSLKTVEVEDEAGNKKTVDLFSKSFNDYVLNDIQKRYEKKQINIADSKYDESFEEASDASYARGDQKKLLDLFENAAQTYVLSSDDYTNVGHLKEQVLPYSDLLVDAILGGGDTSPFIMTTTDKDQQYLMPNPDYDEDELRNRLETYFLNNIAWGDEGYTGSVVHKGFLDMHVNNQMEVLNNKLKQLTKDIDEGKTKSAVTRQNENALFWLPSSLPQTWWNATNNKDLLGQFMTDFGQGTAMQIAGSWIQAGDFGNGKYMGTEGGVTMRSAPVSTNSAIVDPNDPKNIIYFTDLIKYEESQINDLLRDVIAGNRKLANVDHLGRPLSPGSRQGNLQNSNKVTQDFLFRLAEAGMNLDAIYFSPGTATQNMRIQYDNEKAAIKELGKTGLSFYVEVPTSYNTMPGYKKQYHDNLDKADERMLNNIISWKTVPGKKGKKSKGIFGTQNVYFDNPIHEYGNIYKAVSIDLSNPKEIAEYYGIATSGENYEMFKENFEKIDKKWNSTMVNDLITSAQLGNLKNWRVNRIVNKVKVQASDGKKWNPLAKNYINGVNHIDKDGVKSYVITAPGEVSGFAVKDAPSHAIKSNNNDYYQTMYRKWLQEQSRSTPQNNNKTYSDYGYK